MATPILQLAGYGEFSMSLPNGIFVSQQVNSFQSDIGSGLTVVDGFTPDRSISGIAGVTKRNSFSVGLYETIKAMAGIANPLSITADEWLNASFTQVNLAFDGTPSGQGILFTGLVFLNQSRSVIVNQEVQMTLNFIAQYAQPL